MQQPLKQQLLMKAQKLYDAGNLEQAEGICKRLLGKKQKPAYAYNLLGLICYSRNNYDSAIYNIKKAIEIDPRIELYYYNIAFVYLKQNDIDAAIKGLRTAIACNEKYTAAYLTLSSIYLRQTDLKQAEPLLVKALSLEPELEKAQEMLATVYQLSDRNEEAKSCYLSILEKNKENITALINLGKIYGVTGFFPEGLDCLFKARDLEPDNAIIYNNLGGLCLMFNKLSEAKGFFESALQLDPTRIGAKVNMASIATVAGEPFIALDIFEELLTHPDKYRTYLSESPQYFFNKAKVGLAIAYCHTCAWEQADKYKEIAINVIKETIANKGDSIISPFHALVLNLPLEVIRMITAHCVQQQTDSKKFIAQSQVDFDNINRGIISNSDRKIRLAYISPDFGDHAVGLLLRGLFGFHNRDKFEVYALSLRAFTDQYATVIKNSVEHFIELGEYSDQVIIEKIQALGLDILVDLAGYTTGSRPAVIMSRLARKQANWFGYPYPMENQVIDYFITHPVLTPKELAEDFSEQIAYLPNVWLACEPFEALENLPEVSRAEYGLPEGAIVFCCFSNHYRISKELFVCWAKILNQVPASVIWLNSGGDRLDNVLRDESQKLGINPDRLVFSKLERMTVKWRHRLADVWLDPFDFTTGTGTVLCIWAELPVVTLAGSTPQARVGAVTMHGAGLGELVVNSMEEYVAVAIKLVTDQQYLKHIKQQLVQAKHSNLFKPKKFMPELEQVYLNMLHD